MLLNNSTPSIPATTYPPIVPSRNTRPYSVTICLLNEGHVIDQVVLNEENGWSYNFEDLPAGYTYSVSEIAIADYTPSISGNQIDGF